MSDLDNISFESIISDKTHYGIIWAGFYKGKKCIIKTVVLDTGLHYDKKSKYYYNDHEKVLTSTAKKYFRNSGKLPYLHDKYIVKKAMTLTNFEREVTMNRKMSNLNLSPKYYHSFINDTSYKIHYGVIIQERMAFTVKDILLKRELTPQELDYIYIKIAELHQNNISHGDLKPSNTGVNLTRDGTIKVVKFLDWSKGICNTSEDRKTRDIKIFNYHIKKNRNERYKVEF